MFSFWLPMLATWQMMAIEGPLLAAVIARLADATFNLAAYGIAFSLALMVEAPIIMMMMASTALVQDRTSYLRLRNFTITLNIIITVLMIVLILPAIFPALSERLLGLPEQVARLTHVAVLLLLPWPAAIGFRRFYQGLLIRANLTRRIAWGTVLRLIVMSSTALLLALFTKLPGAAVGAAALSMGVIAEAIASRVMVHHTIRILLSTEGDPEGTPNYRGIWSFYYPLAMTSTLALGVHPLIVFFLGQSRMSLESLAVMPVVNSLVFIFRSFGLSFQEVALASFGNKREYFRPVRNFATGLGFAATAGIALIAFTPLATLWFRDISGLDAGLASFAIPPVQLLVLMPATSVLLAVQRAVLVSNRRTVSITQATILEVVLIFLVLFVSIVLFDAVGAIAAALAVLLGRLGANAFLTHPVRRILTGRFAGNATLKREEAHAP